MDLLICFRDHGLRRFAINLDKAPFQTSVYVISKHVVSLPSAHIQRYIKLQHLLLKGEYHYIVFVNPIFSIFFSHGKEMFFLQRFSSEEAK